MDRKLLNSIGVEIDTVCRLRQLEPAHVARELVEWMDFTYHGVVPLPLPETSPKGEDLRKTTK